MQLVFLHPVQQDLTRFKSSQFGSFLQVVTYLGRTIIRIIQMQILSKYDVVKYDVVKYDVVKYDVVKQQYQNTSVTSTGQFCDRGRRATNILTKQAKPFENIQISPKFENNANLSQTML